METDPPETHLLSQSQCSDPAEPDESQDTLHIVCWPPKKRTRTKTIEVYGWAEPGRPRSSWSYLINQDWPDEVKTLNSVLSRCLPERTSSSDQAVMPTKQAETDYFMRPACEGIFADKMKEGRRLLIKQREPGPDLQVNWGGAIFSLSTDGPSCSCSEADCPAVYGAATRQWVDRLFQSRLDGIITDITKSESEEDSRSAEEVSGDN